MPPRFHYEMNFFEHLEELRGRLIIALGWFILMVLCVGLPCHRPVLAFIQKPLEGIVFKKVLTPFQVFVREDGLFSLPGNPLDHNGKIYNTYTIIGNYDKTTSSTTTAETKATSPVLILDATTSLTTDSSLTSTTAQDNLSTWSITIGTDYSSKLIFSNLFTPYLLIFKVAILIGVMLSIPMWVWQLWLFIAPGLKKKERTVIRPIILSSSLLFPLGAGFAYYVLMFAIRIILNLKIPGLVPLLNVTEYLSFVLTFMLVFGLLFQTPLVIMFLVRIGAVSTKFLRGSRKYALVIIMVFSAILTPPDPFTMVAMGLPLFLLFEISIWISMLIEPKNEDEEEENDNDDDGEDGDKETTTLTAVDPT